MTNMTITRAVLDAGLTIDLRIPETWLEYQVPGAVAAFGGDLGQGPESLRPSLQVEVEPAASAEAAFAIIREAVHQLPECAISLDRDGTKDGHRVLTLVFVYRNEHTGGAQVEIIKAIHVETVAGLVIRATGTCGGAASEDTVERLSALVASVQLSELAAVGGA
jgi:hypothetical protein